MHRSFARLALATPFVVAVPLLQEPQPRRERRDLERQDLPHVLEGLERGIASLRALGRHEEAEHLAGIAREVREEFRERPRRDGGEREREVGLHQLEVMRGALHGLEESDRPDAADLLRHAIRAREVALEGREDEEAREIREKAPDRAQVVELLRFGARFLRELGQPDRAEAAERLADEMWGRRGADRRDGPDSAPPAGALAERVERIEDRLARLEGAIEELRAHVSRR
jgi:hypothetical protein